MKHVYAAAIYGLSCGVVLGCSVAAAYQRYSPIVYILSFALSCGLYGLFRVTVIRGLRS